MHTGNQKSPHESPIAIVAVTRNGVRLAMQLQAELPGSVCFVPRRHQFALAMGANAYDHLGGLFPELWKSHKSLVCIMAAGIVVRLITRLLRNKATDPAVVVMDERAQFVISLVSGHLGGANDLAREVAALTGGQAVITTASDVDGRPSIDLIARELSLEIENPSMLARTARAILEEESLWVFDPDGRLRKSLAGLGNIVWWPDEERQGESDLPKGSPGIWVSERMPPPGVDCLILRPRNLVVGLGCNRGTGVDEILGLLKEVLGRTGVSAASIRNLASIDLKKDEPGLLDASAELKRPIHFYPRRELEGMVVPNPSPVVESHIGVQSVCEAAALLSAGKGNLVIPKQKTANVTLAVARVDYPL